MNNEQHGTDLPTLYNALRGSVPFMDLSKAAAAAGHPVAEQTLIRIGDHARPYPTPVRPETLIGAAVAINQCTPHRTTPWILWEAHGVSFEIHHGLWGRRNKATSDAEILLPPGWETLSKRRLVTLNRVGSALLAEQEAIARTREIAQLRARVAELEATGTNVPQRLRAQAT